MNKHKVEEFEYLSYKSGERIEVVFFTARKNLSFNRRTEEGQKNLNKLKEWFNLEKVVYMNQIHSDIVHIFDNSDDIINSEGDGLVTNNKNTAIGIFTADCVPILLTDETSNTIAAVHSGWRGTYENIVGKAIDTMVNKYNCNPQNIKAFIGPHNKECCYEVSEELIEKFKNLPLFMDKDINFKRNLNLENCIKIQLLNKGLTSNKIISANQCTFCSKDLKLFSYRREEEKEGRMYSFVYIK